MDPDEDSDNSSVYVQGLNDNVTLEDLADFFKQCGVVKVRRNTGRPPAGRAWGKGIARLPRLHIARLPLALHFQELAGLWLAGQ